jgi:hypothetical protein
MRLIHLPNINMHLSRNTTIGISLMILAVVAIAFTSAHAQPTRADHLRQWKAQAQAEARDASGIVATAQAALQRAQERVASYDRALTAESGTGVAQQGF